MSATKGQAPIDITHEGTYYHDWFTSDFAFIGQFKNVTFNITFTDNGYLRTFFLNQPADGSFNGMWAAEPIMTSRQRQVKW